MTGDTLSTPTKQQNAEALWAFALDLYRRPGVADHCLTLQDRGGADVTVLLFVLWLGADRGVALSVAELAAVADAVQPWHQEIVKPLRAVRRLLKQGPPPAPDAATDALRQRLKAVELEAERLELQTLAHFAPRQGWSATAAPSIAAAQRNLATLTARLGIDSEPWCADASGCFSDALARRAEAASAKSSQAL